MLKNVPIMLKDLCGAHRMTTGYNKVNSGLSVTCLLVKGLSYCMHLPDWVAVALWRGNACLWLHRQPPLAPAIDGVL